MPDRGSRDLKVLLVEDVEDTRLFMRLELEDQGFIVFEAENGQIAVELAAREKPDVILITGNYYCFLLLTNLKFTFNP